MKIKHDRLPREVESGYFKGLVTFFLEDWAKREEIDLTNTHCVFGRTDTRGNFKIEINLGTLPVSCKNSIVNGWSGFQNMREMVAFLEGYRNAIRGW